MVALDHRAERLVTFPGTTARLRGKVSEPDGGPRALLVVAHGRNGDMEEPLVAGLAGRGAEIGLWTLRFNFAFRELQAEPSAGFEDEIEDLRQAIAFARHESTADRVIVAGRGFAAWPTVAAVTDEDAEDAILLGLSYEGQPERKMALRRLGEFEIATLAIVGAGSDRADIPALREIFAKMPTARLEVLNGADHRLRDAKGNVMIRDVIARCEPWITDQLR